MTILKQCLKIVLVIVTTLSMAISTVVLSGGMIYRLYHHFDFMADRVGLTEEALFQNIDVMMRYLIFPGSAPLVFPHFSSSAGGVQHFAEVKHLMQLNFILSIIGMMVLIMLRLKKQKSAERWQFYHWLGYAYYAPVVLLGFIILAFDKVFVLFHEIFFSNDLWLFNPVTDPIINVLPQNLFMVYFIIAIVIYELFIFIYRKIIIL